MLLLTCIDLDLFRTGFSFSSCVVRPSSHSLIYYLIVQKHPETVACQNVKTSKHKTILSRGCLRHSLLPRAKNMPIFQRHHLILPFLLWLSYSLSLAGAFSPTATTTRALTVRGGASSRPSSSTTMVSLFKSAAVRAGLQSGCIMTVADIMTQLVVEKRSLQDDGSDSEDVARYDPVRSLRWCGVGLALHGPYFRYCFSRLDQMFKTQSLLVVAKKTALAQFIVFPPYLVALFTTLGLLEGSTEILEGIRTKVPKAFMSGCIFWPIANAVNFSLVPSTARVPYLASVGALWNGYLSWMNSK